MRAWRVGVVAVLAAVGCGANNSTAPTTPERPTAATTRTTAATALSANATCGDYLDATEPQREVSTQAALIVARQAAGGVRTTPSQEMRALFEIAVGLVCQRDRSLLMLNAMALVVARDSGYVS